MIRRATNGRGAKPPRARRSAAAVASFLAIGIMIPIAPARAWAQAPPAIDARTWRPSADPEANLVLEPVSVPCAWCWNETLWLAYAQDPVEVRSGDRLAYRYVAPQLGGDLTAGIGVGGRTFVGVDLPFVFWQESSIPAGPNAPGSVPTAAIGDVTLSAKVSVLPNDRQGIASGLGVAAVGAVSFPTGNRTSTLGEGAVTASVRALVEYALGAAAVRGSIGFALRPDERTVWADLSAPPVPFGQTVPWALGIVLRPKAVLPAVDSGDRQTWELAAHGALPAGPVAPFGLGRSGATALSPALVAVDDRFALGARRDFYLVAALDVGLDRAVGVPLVRGVVSFGWAPRKHDRDDDGVPDDVDQCPELPEDRDGIQDEDGCPEDDADGDDVPDDQDACPLVPGVPSTDPKRNGCPAPGGPPAGKP